MPTDDERREVAARLRELRYEGNGGVTSYGHGFIASLALAVLWDDLDAFEAGTWFNAMCGRLADLMEPADSKLEREATEGLRRMADRMSELSRELHMLGMQAESCSGGMGRALSEGIHG